MAPNPFLLLKLACSPHKWFTKTKKVPKEVPREEHWTVPTPGTYRFVPGRGWFLVATDSPDPNGKSLVLATPEHVKQSLLLGRYMLASEYNARKRTAPMTCEDGRRRTVTWFRLDDGVSWVNLWDCYGDFIEGPYDLWCVDGETGDFRKMKKSDDPTRASRQASKVSATDAAAAAASSAAAGTLESSRARSNRTTSVTGTEPTPAADAVSPSSASASDQSRAHSEKAASITSAAGTTPAVTAALAAAVLSAAAMPAAAASANPHEGFCRHCSAPTSMQTSPDLTRPNSSGNDTYIGSTNTTHPATLASSNTSYNGQDEEPPKSPSEFAERLYQRLAHVEEELPNPWT
ncbi:hypothetical protein K402DRAFT_244336 [Aulographum hederae CBS 113979]|uniref:Uncharacterized protein n=1 Tax=Aulographum hederae CBS 113979 TaxID=1176131 RepID=A0A6G1HAB0_9PEZI|nr:hypothetical protein K402DRAFT_244336 [Aulographum hederae CBS 113979]